MKLTINSGSVDAPDAVVDVTFNPARKNDGRPAAEMEYTVSLRVDSKDGTAKLTVGTDFTPPAVLAVLPEWSVGLARLVLGKLGFYAPELAAWMVARDGVYAYVDAVTYVEPTGAELDFMASFGFTPGARFNLALPMLRAMRAELASGTWRADVAEVAAELAADIQVDPAAFVAPEVGGAGVPMETPAVPVQSLPALNAETGERESKPTRRRKAAAPKVVETVLVTKDDAKGVSAVRDEKPTPAVPTPAVERNPFAIEGL